MNNKLSDQRPPSGGEYLYVDCGVTDYSGMRRQYRRSCFVCGTISESDYEWRFLIAKVQCLESGTRIMKMFKYRPFGPEDSCMGAELVISACPRHGRNVKVLSELTSDGIITESRVQSATCSGLSLAEFHALVAEKARVIWEKKERERSFYDWRDGWDYYIAENGHIPSRAQRSERAQRLWEERKQDYAQLDWAEAEAEVLKQHSLAADTKW
jgi:hypothetical protein